MLLTTTGGRRACIIGKYTRALAEPLGFNLQSLNHFRGRRCWRWRSREGLHIRHIRNLKCEAFFSAHAKCASIAASLKAFAVFISGILEEVIIMQIILLNRTFLFIERCHFTRKVHVLYFSLSLRQYFHRHTITLVAWL